MYTYMNNMKTDLQCVYAVHCQKSSTCKSNTLSSKMSNRIDDARTSAKYKDIDIYPMSDVDIYSMYDAMWRNAKEIGRHICLKFFVIFIPCL
jgi:hypothetical protein